MKSTIRSISITLMLCAAAACLMLRPAWCQHVKMSIEPLATMPKAKTMTSGELKAAVTFAASKGDINQTDGQELINKITDIETLMAQFDFIQEQERRMVSSIGSTFH